MGISSFEGEGGTRDLYEETRQEWWDVSAGHRHRNFQVSSAVVRSPSATCPTVCIVREPWGRTVLVLLIAVGSSPARSLLWTLWLTYP